jgi:UDP-N-acetylglucosamine acyltransferase
MPIDPSARVAASAQISSGAEIGPEVEIGPFCVIEEDVTIGPRTCLEPHVYLKRWTTLGADNRISAGTVLGTDPLDRSFGGGRSYLVIGDRNRIREHYTISRGTQPESVTAIGADSQAPVPFKIPDHARPEQPFRAVNACNPQGLCLKPVPEFAVQQQA